jgi:hypothetical protein
MHKLCNFHYIILYLLCYRRIGKVLIAKSDIEKIGKPEHDPDYLRAKMEYNLMALQPGYSQEDSLTIIENDLPRTYPNLKYFRDDNDEGKENQKVLRKILRAFVMVRPDIGYVQGMSYIAGFIYMESERYRRKSDPMSDTKFQFEREFTTFLMFQNLITSSQILLFYRFNSDEIIQ